MPNKNNNDVTFYSYIEQYRDYNLPTSFQQIIHQSKYSRWIESEQRRETWFETVLRYIEHFRKRFSDKPIPVELWCKAFEYIVTLKAFPSMRSFWSAGKALEKDEICNYNCAYLVVNYVKAFSELFFLLLAGVGVGYSVERQEIAKLPDVPEELYPSDTVIVVKDSKLGWVQSYNELISLLYSGRIPKWDLRLLRPAGSRLKTTGGRSSGPRALDDLFKATIQIFKNARGRKLTSVECHTVMTTIASAVQIGGTRRCCIATSLITLETGEKVALKNISIGDNIDAGDGTFTTVTNIFDNGNQEVVRVHLEDGTYFECTEEHRWLVYNQDKDLIEFVETRNLKNGNYCMLS